MVSALDMRSFLKANVSSELTYLWDDQEVPLTLQFEVGQLYKRCQAIRLQRCKCVCAVLAVGVSMLCWLWVCLCCAGCGGAYALLSLQGQQALGLLAVMQQADLVFAVIS